MKNTYPLFLYAAFLLLLPAFSLQAVNFSGTFTLNQNGVVITLSGEQKDSDYKGTLVSGQDYATVTGVVGDDEMMSGVVAEGDGSASYLFSAVLHGETLIFSMYLGLVPVELSLQRSTAAATSVPPAASNVTLPNNNTAPPNKTAANIDDNRLVGLWRYTDVMSSGGFGDYMSWATDYFLLLNADGTFEYTQGSSAGGGSYGAYEAGGSVIAKGTWSSADKNLMLYYDGQTEQIPYSCDGNNMMHKTNKRIWERVR
ncbi:MAG: hypothetical protein IPL35_03855 [Sphingobacteriales bacterium]|nr:hypothetical protein [Sphingobacteriales bacterium]